MPARDDDEDEQERRDREVADGVEQRRGPQERLRPEEAEALGELRAEPDRVMLARLLERRPHCEQRHE